MSILPTRGIGTDGVCGIALFGCRNRWGFPPIAAPFSSPPLADTHASRRDDPLWQVFFACGAMLLVFELFAVPIFTPRLGVRLCQRLGSVVEVPIYVVIPFLSHMNSTGLLVQAFAAILLFLFLAASDPVRACP